MITQVLILVGTMLLTTSHALTSTEKAQFTGLTFTDSGNNWRITTTGIPDHATGSFPNNDNPNTIETQSYSYLIPQSPSDASDASCLPGGPIGFGVNGIPFYSPFTFEGENAVEGEYAEVFDSCDGHPDQKGSYHYHQRPDCVANIDGDDKLIGVMLDGYPIYSPTIKGKTYKSEDLDTCHGTTIDGAYRYVLTADYPYVLGCFKGNIVDTSIRQGGPECKFAKGATLSFSLGVLLVSLLSVLLQY